MTIFRREQAKGLTKAHRLKRLNEMGGDNSSDTNDEHSANTDKGVMLAHRRWESQTKSKEEMLTGPSGKVWVPTERTVKTKG